ncbi:Fpg/Nei family DNA glycosylase [uncultured Amnibacterium sp.]|uniref:Fpg/Nei family DNA glycosylase n=1 Tax=uncultured Amnibacterium sp. TaxID=1631851 RepID=UPI0035CC9262
MPEGHSVHRIALQFRRDFVGHRVAASSPQGRFAAGAAELDGRRIVASTAVGKHLLLEFEGERTLHVHLGLYGAWDFAGDVTSAPTFTVADGRIGDDVRRSGLTDQLAGYRDGALSQATPEQLAAAQDAKGERNLRVGGRTTLRMSESDRELEAPEGDFPPPPVGQVRVRLLTETAVADLRGPTACEVFDPQQVERLVAKLGPDPMHDASRKAENRFVERVLRSATPIGLQLMDQSVVAGIGNIYRAELLFRARLDPHAPGRTIPEAALRRLWKDWAHLLAIGVETGQMLTRADLKTEEDYRRALAHRDARHYVYKRTGQRSLRGPGTVVMEDMGGRSLYWAPGWQTRPER